MIALLNTSILFLIFSTCMVSTASARAGQGGGCVANSRVDDFDGSDARTVHSTL
jgi:hypothetical protein